MYIFSSSTIILLDSVVSSASAHPTSSFRDSATPLLPTVQVKVKLTYNLPRKHRGVLVQYSSALSLTSVLDGGGWLRPLYTRE
jgi:hypothetical protein